jgi:hypothetical protein
MLRWRQSEGLRRHVGGNASEPGVAMPLQAVEDSQKASAVYEGATTGIHDGKITGWAWDAARPYEPVSVDLFVDDMRVWRGAAHLFDIGLAKANRGNGMHHFEARLERLPARSAPFVIRAVISGTDVELLPAISVTSITEAEALLSANDYIGEISGIVNGAVCGWVLNRHNPHDAPVLTLRDGDRDVATQIAAERITRVLDSGVTATAFRFELALPQSLLDGKPHALTVLAGAPVDRILGTPFLFGPSDVSSIVRILVSVSDRLDQLERRLEGLRPAWDFAQFEKRVTATVLEPVDMLLNVHRDSIEREMAVVRRQVTEIIRHIPDIELDFLAPAASLPAIEDVTVPAAAVFDPVDRSQPLITFDLSTQSPLVQPRGEARWDTSGDETGIAVSGNGDIELDAPLGDDADVVIRGRGASDAAEFSAIVVSFNGRPMSGRFDVFGDGHWAFTGGVIDGAAASSPAKPTLAFHFLAGGSRPSGRLRIRGISFFALRRGPSRVEAQAPTATILNLGRDSAGGGWHPAEAGPHGGVCWMGEMSDVSVSLRPTGAYRISIPEIRPLVADLMPKLQMFLDGELVNLEIAPMAHDPSAYSAEGLCQAHNGSHEMHTLRISFPKVDVKSPMELGLNPDLRPLTIAVRCIMLTAIAS